MSVAVALTLCDSPFGFTVSYTESRAPPACYHEAVKSKLAAMKALPSETDFIVVGAGIAGLRASVELASAGRVLCLAKREVTESNTQYAQGGIAAALSDDDEVRLHLEDTLKAAALKAITFREFEFTTDLLVRDGRVVGVRVLDQSGQAHEIFASSILLATGGLGHVWSSE